MLLDFIDLKNGSGAVYRRLYEALYTAIVSGVIKNGERLPSIREAAEQLSVSRTTVESAYLKLCIEGLAARIRRKSRGGPKESKNAKCAMIFRAKK